MKLSEYIRGKITENKWTYNQAAEFYDVSPTTITGTVNGKFDIPSMRLLRKYAAKENIDEYALLNKLSYLPIVEKDMTASAEIMDKIRKEEDEWFGYSRRLLRVQFMVSTKKRFPNFNEKNVILVDDNTCDPARSSYLKNIISDIISSTSRHDSALHYIAYIDKDPDETISCRNHHHRHAGGARQHGPGCHRAVRRDRHPRPAGHQSENRHPYLRLRREGI